MTENAPAPTTTTLYLCLSPEIVAYPTLLSEAEFAVWTARRMDSMREVGE